MTDWSRSGVVELRVRPVQYRWGAGVDGQWESECWKVAGVLPNECGCRDGTGGVVNGWGGSQKQLLLGG